MAHFFEHYNAPKDSRNNAPAIMDKARFARLEILKHFIRGQAQQIGVDYDTIDNILKRAPEIVTGQTAKGKNLTLMEKHAYAMLSLGNSAAFAFRLKGLQKEELSPKITEIESTRNAGLTIDTIRQESANMKTDHPELAHILDCLTDYLTA